MVVKVNRAVMFLNMFTQVGRNANREISKLRKLKSSPIYQNHYFGKSLSLLQKNLNEDYFYHIDTNGVRVIKETKNRHLFDFKIFSSNKKYLDKDLMPQEVLKKEVVYNLKNNKIEEDAKTHSHIDGPSITEVRSAAKRESNFPLTALARKMHLGCSKKKHLRNGDTIYIEKHLSK